MKKIGLIVFLVTLTLGSIMAFKSGFGKFNVFNFNSRTVRGSGESRTVSRDVSGFQAIKVSGAIQVEVAAQKDFAAEVETDDNLLEFVKMETDGNTLRIYTEGKISSKSGIRVRISMPEIKAFEISGASTGVLTNVKSDSLTLEATGASKIKVDGEAKTLVSEASGASGIDAENLRVENANVEANGASKTTVSATGELKADASGASTIYYTGEPKNVFSKNTGASSVKRK